MTTGDETRERVDDEHPQYAEPLLLRDVYGMAYSEIADLLAVPPGTIKARIHHGRQLARPSLRESTL